ncbi:Cohesin loading factor subunit SCC2 [Fasciola hepatica]|uniref:Nipped-B protein n=1 Tax=Fasciola hepatica TaxID=6192 RepID=A0A4E0RV57_FASHE|nr:Cohesin loading factor subunit SCC2 [Fasciola hepatica]
MNGDISRIPIQSLGAVVSLTDILPELPLPTPLQSGSASCTLLSDPQLTENAHSCLQSVSNHLSTYLCDALERVCTDSIDFKDGFASDSIDLNSAPTLLTSLLLSKYQLFQNKRGFFGLHSFSNQVSGSVPPGAVGRSVLKINSESWQAVSEFTTNCRLTLDEQSQSPTKKKKKKKKKKHKHRDGEGDTSGTGGESSATTPATYDGTTPSQRFDDSGLSPTPTYGVVADTNKLSLKIFKRPVNESTTQSLNDSMLFDLIKKEKKKKRSKERDREHKSKRDRRLTPVTTEATLTTVSPAELPNGSSTLPTETVSYSGTPVCPVSLPCSANNSSLLTEAVTAASSATTVIPSAFDTLTHPMTTSASTTELSFMSNDSLFDHIGSTHLNYQQPQSQSTSSLPSTPASTVGASRSTNTSAFPPVSSATSVADVPPSNSYQNRAFNSQPTLFDGLLNDSTMSFIDSTAISSADLLAVASSCPLPTSAANTMSMCNIMDFASHYLQNEMLSSTSPCDSFPNLGTVAEDPVAVSRTAGTSQSSPHAFNSSFMITSHLGDTLSVSSAGDHGFSLPTNMLSAPGYESLAGTSPSTAFVNNFDITALSEPMGTHHVPMGLASYLAASGQPQAAQTNAQIRKPPLRTESRLSTPQAWWKRKAPGNLRRKRRRKNEVEDLQSWTVKYPTAAGAAAVKEAAVVERATDERTWDDAIGDYSQVLGERAKRRKRLARQTGNFDPAFVFEHDKDYHNGGESDAAADEESKTIDLTHESDATGEAPVSISSRGLRSGAAQRSYAGMDDDEEGLGSVGAAEGGGRRRKKVDDDEPFEVRLKEPVEARFPHLIRKSSEVTRKRRERVGFGTISSDASSHRNRTVLSAAGEVGSLKRFLQRLQSILEAIEDTDLLQAIEGMGSSHDTNKNEHGTNVDRTSVAVAIADNSIPSEAFIAPEELADLCSETAKLNATRIANQIPTDQLLKLLTLLLINIRDGSSVIATLRPDEEADEHENKLWRELAMERVMRSVNAGLTGLLLMTSNDMPREVYVEDVIERTVHTVRFQMFNCIFPEFDPAYRVENSAKENQSSIKSRRARERDVHKPRAIVQLYHKLVEIVSNLARLVKMQRLTDSLVLALSSVGVSVFFVENVSELQLAALELVTAIFAQYEPHRKLIMEEILASLARLPSSKRNLRSYRLNTEDSIQMLTALALLLVQSVIVLPTPLDSKTTQPDSTSTHNEPTADSAQANTEPQKTDDEVLVINSYHNALRTAHTFLLVFLRKSTIKGEDDYRVIFENFVNDLLLAVNKPEWPAAEVMLSLLGSLLVQQFNNKAVDQSIRVASVDYLGTVASTLRRDAVSSQLKEKDIDAVIRDLLECSHSDDEDEEEDETVCDEHTEEQKDRKPSSVQPEQEVCDKSAVTDSVTGKPEVTETKQEDERSDDSNSILTSDKKPKLDCDGQNGFDASSPEAKVKESQSRRTPNKKGKKKSSANTKSVDPIAQLDRVQALRDAILDYLATEDASPTAIYARKFYLAQWLNDCTKETERATQAAINRKTEGTLLNGDGESTSSGTRLSAADQEMVLAISERRKQHILFKISESPDAWRQRRRFWTNTLIAPPTGRRAKQVDGEPTPLVFQGTLDYEDACLVCRFLASLRPFSQSFDVYLTQICRLLSESSVAVRTKALRCLSAVVEADPNVLAREDIERAVQSRLLDTSTSVREAAVDLLGRFLGCKPELTAQYYPMLADRIRDKGVSVRKRVIRILRDICLEQPDFSRIPEICVKMIRRVNDEEGIKKLVNEVFQTMWFSPVRDKETVKLLRKVVNITDVVAACKDTGYEWFEQFLRSLLKKEEGEKVKPVEKACKQIVECLVQNIMRLEEISGQNNQRLVACLATLHLLTKIRPELMVQYTMVLQTYLRCNETSDPHVLHYVARILEVTVPLMEHPSESFVAQLEEDMVKLTLKHGKMVLESCVACLGSIVNRVSKNYSLARDCFSRFFHALQSFRTKLADDPERKIPPNVRPSILRALFTVGLLCKHFDANVFQSSKNTNVRDQVFELLMFFTEQVKSDIEMRKKALSGLGFLCTRHHELLCGSKLREFYQHLLQNDSVRSLDQEKIKVPDHQLELKCIVLENLLNFFLEEEMRMLDADAKWKARQHQESLKEMGDVASGMGSCVAQTYLKDTLEAFFSPFVTVRLTALSVVATILRQGLIHPVQTVPYLIAMQTDLDSNIRVKADAQLQDIDHKFPGFLSMRAIQGVSYSYRLQYILYPETFETVCQKSKLTASVSQSVQSPDSTNKSVTSALAPRRSGRNKNANDSDIVDSNCVESLRPSMPNCEQSVSNPDSPESLFETIRGTRDPLSDIPGALNSNLYSMLRGNRGQRRSLLSGLIALFDESQTSGTRVMLSQLIYVADNLAHFPYQCQEEPLFVIHHIDLMVSMSGSGVLQSVREALFPELKAALEEALAAQAEAEAKNRAQTEMQLRNELHTQQLASAEAVARSDHGAAEQLAEQIQDTLSKLNNLAMMNPTSAIGITSSMNELRSAALVGHDSIPHIDLGPLEEEEEDADAMLARLTVARGTALPIVRDAIRASRACVLLLTLKQYLKEIYSITDSKIQRYSPTDSPKLWERPLTRRAGIRFHPGPCLQAAGAELRKLRSNSLKLAERKESEGKDITTASWPPLLDDMDEPGEEERFEGEMYSLVQDYLEFRKLILTIDPPGEDDLDEVNTSLTTLTTSQTAIGSSTQPPVDQQPFQSAPSSRLRSNRTLVPQSHKSSEEENDSDDSNAGGASRLMLAQSAPAKRRKPTTSLRTHSRAVNSRQLRQKRKRRRRLTAHGSSSGEDSESAAESELSDPDY